MFLDYLTDVDANRIERAINDAEKNHAPVTLDNKLARQLFDQAIGITAQKFAEMEEDAERGHTAEDEISELEKECEDLREENKALEDELTELKKSKGAVA